MFNLLKILFPFGIPGLFFYTETWDETVPAGSRDANLGDDDIREFKRAIRERLAGGGMNFPSTDDANAGLFNNVKFIEQSSNPTAEANRGFLFTKDVSSVTELYWMDSGGNVIQLTSGGKVLLTSLGGYAARGDTIRGSATGWEKLALGASGTFKRSNGTEAAWSTIQEGDVDYTNLPNGAVVQVVNTMVSAVATGSTAIPTDDSIPQNNEGTEFMTRAITPKDTTHLLKIEVVFFGAHNAGSSSPLTVALYQDSTANALAAVQSIADTPETINFVHYMTAGTVSETTFKLRAGTAGGHTVTINGSGGGRLFGGVAASSITITEIKG